jgi:transposase
MARLVQKRVRGHAYWYAVESRRVDGKPRVVWQHYLGKTEDVIARCTEGPGAYDAVVYEFGAVAAVLAIAERLQLEQIVDAHLPPGRQSVGVGRYLLLAAINRVVAPKSKRQIGDWYEDTVLRRLWGLPKQNFTSQRFWQAMDRVDDAALGRIEEDLARKASSEFGLSLDGLIYDATNFYTYIATRHDGSLPQRGHNKQKRNDLKQVNLALLAAADGHVPLLHEVYPGNVPDSKEFAAITARLAGRCRALGAGAVTLVFDKGNNSEENLALVAREGLHFVGSLVPSQHKDILAVPLAAYREVNAQRWPGLLSHRSVRRVYQAERVVVATFNPALWEGQMQGLRAQRGRIEAAMGQLQAKLQGPPGARRGRKPTVESTQRLVARLLRGREPGPYLHFTVQPGPDGSLQLQWHWDDEGLQQMIDRHFGKTLLFSDHPDWTDEQIVAAYRSQAKIEDAFKQMKDTQFVNWRPLYHRLDGMIRVHAAYCVFALLLASLLQRELRRGGASVGFTALMETLAGIRAVVDVPRDEQQRRSVPVSIRLTRRSAEQERLFQLLGLSRFHPEVPARKTRTGTTD